MKLRLSKESVRDIDEAWDYTRERWGPSRADDLLEELCNKFRLLAEYPELGRHLARIIHERLLRKCKNLPWTALRCRFRSSTGEEPACGRNRHRALPGKLLHFLATAFMNKPGLREKSKNYALFLLNTTPLNLQMRSNSR